jgi:hypothetical protein
VLILRDVLGFHAREVAEILRSTEESVTSALKRARATLEERLSPLDQLEAPPAPGSTAERELVGRFVRAFETADVDGRPQRDTDNTAPDSGGTGGLTELGEFDGISDERLHSGSAWLGQLSLELAPEQGPSRPPNEFLRP